MALPALAIGWLMVASVPAIKYKAQASVTSVTRTKLLTETADSNVVTDVLIAPRLDSELYTNRLDVKFVAEPQIFLRQVPLNTTVEFLLSTYAWVEYKLRRDFSLVAVHTTTFGTFPLSDFRGAGGSDLPVNPGESQGFLLSSSYVYTETLAGFQSSFGVKRLNVAGTLGWIVNGLLDYPVHPLKRGEAAYPQQRLPQLRLDAVYGATRRDYLSLMVLGQDVHFSTANRDSLLQVAPGIKHAFSPLVDLSLSPGIALGRVYPRRQDLEPFNVTMPTLEAQLDAPVPLGHHWPVKARLRARYVPYMDPLTTQLVPRGELGVDLKWEGRREAKVTGGVRYAHPLTSGLHRNDQEVRADLEALLPLPLSRYLFLQAKGQFSWRNHAVLSFSRDLETFAPVVQWLTSVGLVVRYDRGRL
ncbi:hypothetical protein [Cystobacter ferrugineus]|uniref:Uncharacterized protein n=1 Tax=Cystobacter ferrugineus TaxID=83449 RepID=A0A1L9AXX9_9BACT|nr:hypothetical protein [Cystobacter ferrugineus]OJH34783.1 hypothetical protein BON30_42280 [Cystobacter ferrugineus]